jgi:hypothetical protein
MPPSNPAEVPWLDLAPKLNRPLSLCNPFDYLRLLYWMFYFPQALSWYIDTFGGGYLLQSEMTWREMTWRERRELFPRNLVQRKLFLQGLILGVVLPLLFAFTLEQLRIEIYWFGVVLGAMLSTVSIIEGVVIFSKLYGRPAGMLLGLVVGVFAGLVVGITLGLTGVVSLGMSGTITVDLKGVMTIRIAFFGVGVITGIMLGVTNALKIPRASVKGGMTAIVASSLFSSIALGSIISLLGIVTSVEVFDVSESVILSLVFGVGLSMASLRIDAWLLGVLGLLLGESYRYFSHAAITFIPLPDTKNKVAYWLRKDWRIGIQNINQIIAFTLQSNLVIEALEHELFLLPQEQMFYRVSQLTAEPYDWELIYQASVLSIDPKTRRFRFDTPAHVATIGFWYLHKGIIQKACDAFEVAQEMPYGQEMFALANTLALFQKAVTVSEIATIEVSEFPTEPVLRPVTWQAMQRFCHVVSDTKTVVGSVSRTSKAFASNRALGELQHILDYVDDLPEAERQLIEDIAKQWRNALLDVATSVGEQTIDAPVQNPYIVGDPVEGSLFVGREDVLRQLEELWLMGEHMQSVVLYGHRRMGKTSILRNAAKTVGSGLRLVYVNMLRSASAESISDVLIAMTDELSEVLEVPAPSDEELMAQPTRNFERYLKRVLDRLGDNETLIIAIDEFEKIEELIDTGKLSPDFIAYLRGLVQMSPKLGFAFAGLHTLEEMTQDYFNPFFASVIPIKVGFLKPGAVRQLLANPNPEFLLDYHIDALDRISQLTSGQPYLTQLIGFQLVRRYNDQVFEQGTARESIFTVADVDVVTTDPEFFKRGRYYFTGVWDQAGRDVPEQQTVLQALAPHPDGLSLDALKSATKLRRANLNAALELLQRHDVVTVQDNQARILVELFRRWLVSQ